MRTLSPLRLALGAAAALALSAAPAQATSVQLSPDGRYLDVTETSPGEVNHLVAKLVRLDGRQYVDLYDDGPITTGNKCATNPDTQITRCVDPSDTIRIALGAGDDRFTVSEVGTDITFGGGVTLDLGPGMDQYIAEGTNAVIDVHGGDGNDDLRGGKNVDHLFGGPGDDKLTGNENGDDLHGEAGADVLTGDGPSAFGIFADTLDGGDGTDRLIDYVFSGDPVRAPAINVSLDGVANDGRQGENDNITAVEIVEAKSAGSFTGDEGPNEFVAPQVGPPGTLMGNGGDDTLIAGDANGDVVDGGAGNDLVEGGFGDDRLVGGPGRDIVNGDRVTRCNELHCDLIVAGNDTIEVRDSEADSVSCGPGIDKVIADAVDTVAADCENVERPSTGGGPGGDGGGNGNGSGSGSGNGNGNGGNGGGQGGGGTQKATLSVVKTKLGRALTQGVKVRFTNVTGTVRLTARRGKKFVGQGSAKARDGKATVTLRFTKAAKRALRRERKVVLRLTGAGVTRTVTLKR